MEEDKFQTIRVTCEDGIERDATVLLFFKLKENNKEYLIYCYDEPLQEGVERLHFDGTEEDDGNDDEVMIHCSSVQTEEDGSYTLLGIDDEHEWQAVQQVMNDVIKNAGAQ